MGNFAFTYRLICFWRIRQKQDFSFVDIADRQKTENEKTDKLAFLCPCFLPFFVDRATRCSYNERKRGESNDR